METQEARKNRLAGPLDIQLKKCGLIRRPFPEGLRSIFKAISDSLYFTFQYSDELVKLCQHELKRRIENNNLPSKLNLQFHNKQLVNDYQQNPDLNGFTKVHFGLVSLVYDKKIMVYSIHQNYLTSIVYNNSSNKHPPILLCKVQNSYSAVISQEVEKIAGQLRQNLFQFRVRICDKLMSHSFSISNKTQKQKVSKILFETPKRPHKKSMSVCDELEYKQIFNNIIPSFSAFQSTKFIKYPTQFDDQDDLTLIGQCNINGKVQYPNIQKNNIFQMSPTPFHRAESMRVPSMINPLVRKDTLEINGSRKHTGRLKFFDQNKNYGFIVMDQDNSDIFVHYDDLSKAGMTKQFMRTTKHGNVIRFEYNSMSYVGKYDKSRKAVDLILLQNTEYPPF